MFFPFPEILHAGQAFEDESNVAFQLGVKTVKGVHDVVDISRQSHLDDATGRMFAAVFIEL